jgi:predicted metal-dependent phosphoesterase TrpH
MFRADLHCHSTSSDGTLSPESLVRHAVEIGLNGLAITDHDTIDAYATALPVAKELGLPLVSGVEFSTMWEGYSVHILGYSFDLDNSDLHAFCKKHHIRREERNGEILQNLVRHGMPVTMEEVLAIGPEDGFTVGRPHIAQAMVQRGYVKTVDEAFKAWIGGGRPCFSLGKSYQPEETIDVIHNAGGLAVIAHPHLIRPKKIANTLLNLPFDGIEGYYARLPLNQEEKWVALAKKQEWICTGGSDFHGTVKPHIPLGCSWVGEEIFQILHDRFQENSQK